MKKVLLLMAMAVLISIKSFGQNSTYEIIDRGQIFGKSSSSLNIWNDSHMNLVISLGGEDIPSGDTISKALNIFLIPNDSIFVNIEEIYKHLNFPFTTLSVNIKASPEVKKHGAKKLYEYHSIIIPVGNIIIDDSTFYSKPVVDISVIDSIAVKVQPEIIKK